MRCIIFFFSLIIALPSVATDIYKWTSKEGQTIYSDIYQLGAEKLSISADKSPETESLEPSDKPEEVINSSTVYKVFDIAQPLHNETIRNADGVVEVGLNLSPGLAPGHVIHVYLDGIKLKEDLTTTQFGLNQLNRGTHSLQAKVVDTGGKSQISTPTVSFHLRQAAIANQ
jgi:hypothetical protein